MDSTQIELSIVPFGKYKGQPITELLSDVKYVEWCKKQEWFQKYPVVYNICVNQTITQSSQNSKTPEHNKLQNMFLEDKNIDKLWFLITQKYNMPLCDKNHKDLSLEGYNVEFEGMFNWDCIFDFG